MLNIGGDCGKHRVTDRETAQDRRTFRARHLLSFAEISRACGLHQDGRASEPITSQSCRDRFPKRLVRMDQVVFGSEFSERANGIRDECDRKQRPERHRANPAMNAHAVKVIIARKARDRSCNHTRRVSSAYEFSPLRKSLALRAALPWMEVADQVADPDRRFNHEPVRENANAAGRVVVTQPAALAGIRDSTSYSVADAKPVNWRVGGV